MMRAQYTTYLDEIGNYLKKTQKTNEDRLKLLAQICRTIGEGKLQLEQTETETETETETGICDGNKISILTKRLD